MGRTEFASRVLEAERGFSPTLVGLASSAPRAPAMLRVAVQQPALPAYRVPVFRALAERPGIRLEVLYGQSRSICNAKPHGFNARRIDRSTLLLADCELCWSTPQLQLAGSSNVDVLVLGWNLHYASLVPALLRARHNRIATVLWGHGYSKHESSFRRWPREQAARLADAVLFYNHVTARDFVDRGHDPSRVFVAANALDQRPIQSAREFWLGQPGKLRAFQEQHELADCPVLLFVSRLEAENRVDLLLHATARLVRTHRRIQTVIIGQGPDEAHLRMLTRRLGIASSVRFLGAVYGEMQLAPWFLSADVFCYPRNIGLSVMHAFGYGVPVVTGDDISSHNPEIDAFQHGANGLLFRDGHVSSLADSLQPLITDRNFRNQLAVNARQTVLERFTLDSMVDGMMDAIRYAALHRRTNWRR